ncbi:hypothetical protein [Pseudobutyrivibrio ruminis]|uniref:hypothetical protein n=1 Tax=Pseudobutyrivibrio ruminis TaxID=46206 RepID=UPI000410A8F8|nr:hypothetical protein [Pseudobutyrivibrio ruminis]
MKKLYAALIITIIAFNPALAFATGTDELNNSPTPTDVQPSSVELNQSDRPTDENTNTLPSSENGDVVKPIESSEDSSANNDVPGDLPKDSTTQVPGITSEIPANEEDNDGNASNDRTTLNNTDKEQSENPSTINSINENTLSDDETIKEDELPNEHEHVFVYEYNGDGTHTKRCTAPLDSDNVTDDSEDNVTEDSAATESTETATIHCDYEEIEACTYGDDGLCIYCKAEKTEEKEDFAPSISFSKSTQSFNMGDANPVISVYISQEDYDIEYAQVCFANYGANKYINVGLAQGKYFDFQSSEFVYTSNDSWSASCNITSDYVSGKYSLRSIYIRSTTGESVHYSIESDSLPDEYKNIEINLNMETQKETQTNETPHDATPSVPISEESIPTSNNQKQNEQDTTSEKEVPEPTNTGNVIDEKINTHDKPSDKESENTVEESTSSSTPVAENNNDNKTNTAKEQQPSESNNTAKDTEANKNTNKKQSSIFDYFNSFLDFMKNFFGWW